MIRWSMILVKNLGAESPVIREIYFKGKVLKIVNIMYGSSSSKIVSFEPQNLPADNPGFSSGFCFNKVSK